jgi:hypothetical protein
MFMTLLSRRHPRLHHCTEKFTDVHVVIDPVLAFTFVNSARSGQGPVKKMHEIQTHSIVGSGGDIFIPGDLTWLSAGNSRTYSITKG